MSDVRLPLPTVLVLLAIVGAAAFAVGRSTAPPLASASAAAPVSPPPLARHDDDQLPPGHPTPQGDLPVGHPPLAATGAGVSASVAAPSDGALEWKVPSRWESVPNTSSMRLATYRVPRAMGDSDDAELSITEVGGSVDANADRWIGQFDAAGQKTAKRTTRKVGVLDVTIVEVQGKYNGGMGKAPPPGETWALLGAIVKTPGTPYFFKLTGPSKTVLAARGELDDLVSSLTPKK